MSGITLSTMNTGTLLQRASIHQNGNGDFICGRRFMETRKDDTHYPNPRDNLGRRQSVAISVYSHAGFSL
jgi:hypothetical protein